MGFYIPYVICSLLWTSWNRLNLQIMRRSYLTCSSRESFVDYNCYLMNSHKKLPLNQRRYKVACAGKVPSQQSTTLTVQHIVAHVHRDLGLHSQVPAVQKFNDYRLATESVLKEI